MASSMRPSVLSGGQTGRNTHTWSGWPSRLSPTHTFHMSLRSHRLRRPCPCSPADRHRPRRPLRGSRFRCRCRRRRRGVRAADLPVHCG